MGWLERLALLLEEFFPGVVLPIIKFFPETFWKVIGVLEGIHLFEWIKENRMLSGVVAVVVIVAGSKIVTGVQKGPEQKK